MKTPTTQKEYTDEEIMKEFLSIQAYVLVDIYTNENVAFGRIKVNEEVPIKRYLEEMRFRHIEEILDEIPLDGPNMEHGCVIERDFHERCFEIYSDRTGYLLADIPIDKSFEEKDGDLYHFKYGWYEYLKELYPIFEEIMKTEVTPDLFAVIPDLLEEKERRTYYNTSSKFVLAIKTKGLRQGGRIDRYINKMNFISPFIKRLIKKQKGHYCLKNNDVNSLDYKLALFSCFRFMNEDNAKLFELKMLQWEENTKNGNNYVE